MCDNHCVFCQGYKDRIKELESKLISLDDWKGKDSLVFERSDDKKSWFIEEHRKSKSTRDVLTNTVVVDNCDVNELFRIIISIVKFKNGVWVTNYRSVIREIISVRNIDIESDDAFNGGKYRSKYYFRYYYYPLKVLEHLGFVEYGRSIKLTEKTVVKYIRLLQSKNT